MRELLAGLVPGLPARPRATHRGARGRASRCTRSRPSGCCWPRAASSSRTGVYQPVGDLAELAVPETLTALIAARLDALDPADRALLPDAAVLGQSFTPAGLAAVSGHRRADARARLRALVRRELLVLDADPRSPGAGPVRLRPGADPRGRLQHAREAGPQDPPPRRRALLRVARLRRARRRAGGPLPRGAAPAPPRPEADALAAQARLALRAAADRAVALGSHDQAVAFLEQALDVRPSAADRAELHERALARRSRVSWARSRSGTRWGRWSRPGGEPGDRARIAIATAAYADAMMALAGPQRAPASLCGMPGRSSRTWRRPRRASP